MHLQDFSAKPKPVGSLDELSLREVDRRINQASSLIASATFESARVKATGTKPDSGHGR